MTVKGLASVLGPKKGKGKESEAPIAPDSSPDLFDGYASEVYSALQDKDEDGFKAALKSAIEACYGDDSDDE